MWVTNGSVGPPVVAFIRKVRTTFRAAAVQIAEKDGRHNKIIEHVGSAYTDAALVETARAKLLAGQQMLDLGIGGVDPGSARITGKHARWLIEAITVGSRASTSWKNASSAMTPKPRFRQVRPTSISDTARVGGSSPTPPAHRNTSPTPLIRCTTRHPTRDAIEAHLPDDRVHCPRRRLVPPRNHRCQHSTAHLAPAATTVDHRLDRRVRPHLAAEPIHREAPDILTALHVPDP